MPGETPTDRTWRPSQATWSADQAGEEPAEPVSTEKVERLRELGRGGMGVVWLGVQSQLGREVAVKTLQPGADDIAWQSLVREGRIAARLEHPNIVPVHDLSFDGEEQPQLVMKRLQGRPWDELIEHPERLPPEERTDPVRFHLDVLRQVCRAVEYAHAHDVVHRDLKPGNVMVGAFGEVTVLDWGAAVFVGQDPGGEPSKDATQSTVIGTLQYMAPEMLQPSLGALGPASDLYLLGGMLLEALTREPPRPVGSFDEHRAWSQRLPDLPEGLPADLRALLERVLDPDPAKRGTVAAFRQVLERHGTAVVVEEARQRVLSRIAALDQAMADGDPDQVLRMYGEVRYGLEALHEKGEGLELELQDALLRRMVGYELERDEVGAARLLLSHTVEPPPDLVAAVNEAEARVQRQQERMRRLNELFDTRTGQVLRAALGVLLMSVFLGQSVLADVAGIERGYLRQAIADPTRFLFVATVVLLFWRSLRRSHVTRALVGLALFAPVVAMPITLAMWLADLPPMAVALARPALDATLVFFGGLVLDRRLLPAGVLYLASLPIAAAYPEWITPVFAVPTVAVGLSLLVMFGRERS